MREKRVLPMRFARYFRFFQLDAFDAATMRAR